MDNRERTEWPSPILIIDITEELLKKLEKESAKEEERK